jgi:hypothetical protein
MPSSCSTKCEATTMTEGTACNSADEAPKSEFVASTPWGGSPISQAPVSIWPHALAPLVMMLIGSHDLCLDEDSVIVNLLPIL